MKTKPTLPPELIPANIEAMLTPPRIPTTGEEIALEYLGKEIKKMGFDPVALSLGTEWREPWLRFTVYPITNGWLPGRGIKIKCLEPIKILEGLADWEITDKEFYLSQLTPILIIEGVSLSLMGVPELMRILRDIKNSNNLSPC